MRGRARVAVAADTAAGERSHCEETRCGNTRNEQLYAEYTVKGIEASIMHGMTLEIERIGEGQRIPRQPGYSGQQLRCPLQGTAPQGGMAVRDT